MEKEIKPEKSYKKTLIFFVIASALSIIISALAGEIMFPFSAALFASLLFYERDGHIFSIVCGVVSVVASLIFFTPSFVWSVLAILCGIIIYFMHRGGSTKFDTSMVLTLVVAFGIFLIFLLYGFYFTEELSFESVADFYGQIYEFFKNEFVSSVMETYSALGESAEGLVISQEYVSSAFDAFVNTLPSVIIIIAFVYVGILLKVYTAIRSYIADRENNDKIIKWRFRAPVIYAYAYIVLYILSVFVAADDTFGIAVANLCGIFSAIFAYVGISNLYRMLKGRGHGIIAVILPIIGILLGGTFAFDIFAIVGIIYTLYSKNQSSASGIGSDEN